MKTKKAVEDAHVPFLIITPKIAQRLKRLRIFGKKLVKLVPRIKHDLRHAGLECQDHAYMIAAFLSSVFLSILFFALFFALSYAQDNPMEKTIYLSVLSGTGMFLLLLFIFAKYPSIISRKIAGDIDKHLIFAIKDLLLHTSSGSSLFNAMLSVSEAGYGRISKEFENVAREIHSGTPTDKALENLVTRTDSEYLKKVIWQLINTLRSGGNLRIALNNIVADLTSMQRANIVNYANELNLWSLVYMLFAVAAPTIGMTMMIILSSFADVGVNEIVLVGFVFLTLVIQIVIIGFIKARRPMVEF